MAWGRRESVAFLTFALVSAAYLFQGIESIPYHGDEGGWITSGVYYYRLFFESHEFRPAAWAATNPGRDTFGYINPPLSKYIIGWSVNDIAGDGFNYFYEWEFSPSWNKASGRIPPADVLMRGRAFAALFAVAAVLLYWVALKGVFDWRVASLSGLLVLFNPVFKVSVVRVMTEPYLFFFWSLNLLALVAYVRRSGADGWLLPALGVTCGLCFSSKLLGGVCLAYTSFAVLLHRSRERRFRTMVLGQLVLVSSFFITVMLVNPFLYPTSDPGVGSVLARFMQMISYWNERFPMGEGISPAERIRYLFVPNSTILADGIFAVTGFVLLARQVYKTAGYSSAKALPLMIFFTTLLSGLVIQLTFERWFLFVIWAFEPLAAYQICVLFDAVSKMLRKRN